MRRVGPGAPEPLGVTLVPGGANVAVYSAHADAIALCLFDGAGQTETERVLLPERSGDVFHGFVAGIAPGTRYGLRAHGPYDPRNGHRFNAAKLLVDPYATALDRRFSLHPELFGELPDGVTRNDADSAPFVPKAIARAPWRSPAPAPWMRPPWSDTVVYELHVRGFTRKLKDVPEALRGTCAGLAHPAAIDHLVRLGITTVELMPLVATIDERHLAALGLTNYWHYNPAALFVPDPRLAPGGIDELAACAAALHAAGIEVVQDVVFNHSGEGDALGPTLSLRGLDNATYYRTVPGDAARYVNDTGCGNTLALDRPPVLRLVMDALRHYAAAGIDGFRFDLATTLGRRDGGFDPAAPLLQAIAQDPLLRELKLIAEPWDLGPGGYQLGAFPADWGEWNDAYRDTVRRFWRGDAGMTGALATRLAGSADIFAPRSRRPSRSVNFVTAHDGFTLADLVAYETKHNAANGEDNRDGTDANLSWNHGVEGTTTDLAILAARRRDVKNLLATLLLSHGTPMLAMGDELGRSQQGNNNTYAQDNALSWVDWEHADRDLASFTGALIDLRRRHAALRGERELDGAPVDDSGIPDVEWRRPDGGAMAAADWSRGDSAVLIAVLYAAAVDGLPADRVGVAINAGRGSLTMRWPEPRAGHAWRVLIDTALPSGVAAGDTWADASTTLAARSVIVLGEEPSAAAPARSSGIEPEALGRLAAAAGIAPTWVDIAGGRHVVAPDTTRALLAAMGLGVDTPGDARLRLVELAAARERRRLPCVCVTGDGAAATVAIADDGRRPRFRGALRLTREDGTETMLPFRADDCPASATQAADGRQVAQRLFRLPPLPAGYHALRFDDDPEHPCRIVVAPPRCYLPPELRAGARRFGVAAHHYALRRAGDQGIGDFTALAELAGATARVGGGVVGVNPLHALFAGERERASPYHPSDRRFLDPIYLDVERIPELAASPAARELLSARAGAIAGLAARTTVDYTGVWEIKRAVLAACFAAFESCPGMSPRIADFDRFVAAGGEPLRRFALFEAIAACHPGTPWTLWPPGLRRPDAPEIAAFAEQQRERVRFALYLQWIADGQLAAAARDAREQGLAIGFYRDLAIGAAPDGAEAWANAGSGLAVGVSIGAPPDPLAMGGQVWQLPPPIPGALTATGYAGFRQLVAANMRHAGALRIDHVMGIARLFWIPDGAPAMAGAYVGYPQEDLLAVLAVESHRARCLVVGEDLGTVPDGFRERLDAADVLAYRVLWFEREGRAFRPPSHYSAKAAACISTHDLPTVAGWWNGADIEERRALGLAAEAQVAEARTERQADREALVAALDAAGVAPENPVDAAAPHTPAVTAAVHRYACASPAALVLIQADDLAGETVMLNLPGTDRERANWRRRIAVDAGALWETAVGRDAARDFAARRP